MSDLWAFDEATCTALAARHGTPTFAYSANIAARTFGTLRSMLPSRVRLAYAVKANPLPRLLTLFAEAGASFDVASAGELRRVIEAGVGAERIFFAGPGKKDHEILRAVRLGLRLQAEGMEDLLRVDACARQFGLAEVAVNLRVQPLGVESSLLGGNILGGSGPTAFGVDEEDLPDFLEAASRLGRVRIRGLHGFAASNELDADRLLANHERLFRIGLHLRERYGLELEQIDLGGGLGVPYDPDAAPLDLPRFGRGIERLLATHDWFRGELILEPGRFLAAPCGVYLARVVRTKRSRGTLFAILDGGIHHLLRPLLTGQPFPVRASENREGEPREPTTLAGPLCTALDRLGTLDLPPLRPGDLLTFGMVGAYGATEAMVRFLDHPPAEEIWVEPTASTNRAPSALAATEEAVQEAL